jgi:hypothetical protein
MGNKTFNITNRSERNHNTRVRPEVRHEFFAVLVCPLLTYEEHGCVRCNVDGTKSEACRLVYCGIGCVETSGSVIIFTDAN